MRLITLLLLYALLIVGFAVGWVMLVLRYQRSADLSPQSAVLQVLTECPVQDLVLQEATFDIITKAKIDDNGNPTLHFLASGVLWPSDSKEVLFRGCILVRYGIDVSGIGADSVQIRDNDFVVPLPPPSMLGSPIILTGPECESRILDVQGEGWWAGYLRRADIQTRIHQEYARNAPRLCEELNLEAKTREQAERLLQGILGPLLRQHSLNLVIEWLDSPNSPRIDNNTSMKGIRYGYMLAETSHLDAAVVGAADRPGADLVDSKRDDSICFFRCRGSIDDSGSSGVAPFRVAGEPAGRLPDAGFRTAESERVSAE